MISVAGLSFTYPKTENPAISGLEFSIQQGEIFGFLGPNGAGKSTTQKILIRLLRNYQGQVQVLGRDLSKWDNDYFEQVGVAFEFPNHFLKLSAFENLNYFRSLYSSQTFPPQSLLEMVGLEDDGVVPVSQFSKGMKSRLSIARSLLNDPDLIFLDEPTGGLDPVGARKIKNLIRQQKKQGKTIFLTTHDMTVADELCDRVAFIVDGRIDLIGVPRSLKLEHGDHRVRVEFQSSGSGLAETAPRQADEGLNASSSLVTRREFPLAGLGDNREFLDLLGREEVQTIHSLEATLEDVFIKVTGRGLQ